MLSYSINFVRESKSENNVKIVTRKENVQYIEISSWEVVTYGIYARVNLFSQNERASFAKTN